MTLKTDWDRDAAQSRPLEMLETALEKIGASESLYTTQAIEDEDIPLWTPGGDPAVGGGAARVPAGRARGA